MYRTHTWLAQRAWWLNATWSFDEFWWPLDHLYSFQCSAHIQDDYSQSELSWTIGSVEWSSTTSQAVCTEHCGAVSNKKPIKTYSIFNSEYEFWLNFDVDDKFWTFSWYSILMLIFSPQKSIKISSTLPSSASYEATDSHGGTRILRRTVRMARMARTARPGMWKKI